MAGINRFGANYNRDVNGANFGQAGNAKKTQQAQNELTELKLNTNQLDGFVKSNSTEQTREEDLPKFDDGGDAGKIGDWLKKVWDGIRGEKQNKENLEEVNQYELYQDENRFLVFGKL